MMSQEKVVHMVKCCECLHAKEYREICESTGQYIIKVRCRKGHWRHGRLDGSCDLHRVMARRTARCPDYVTTSDSEEDRQEFLRDLAASLPVERIVFEANGEAVDITEVEPWGGAI